MFPPAILLLLAGGVAATNDACAEAEMGEDETCALQVRADKGCCRALTAECMACSAGMTEAEYCQQNPTTAGCPGLPENICTLCESCGGPFSEDGGRTTYFQGETTSYYAFSEGCAGQLRERSGDGTVIYSPSLCCTRAGASLIEIEEAQKAVRTRSAERSVSTKSEGNWGGPGWCRICGPDCGGDYQSFGGRLTSMPKGPSDNSNSQNYEGYEHCGNTGGSMKNPPSGALCCKGSSHESGACAVCQGSCGGRYAGDMGVLSYAEGKTMDFEGYGSGCSGGISHRQGSGRSDLPRMCCMQH